MGYVENNILFGYIKHSSVFNLNFLLWLHSKTKGHLPFFSDEKKRLLNSENRLAIKKKFETLDFIFFGKKEHICFSFSLSDDGSQWLQGRPSIFS